MAADSNSEDKKIETEAASSDAVKAEAAPAADKIEPKMDAKPEPRIEGAAGPKPDAKADAAKNDSGKALATAGTSPINPFVGIAHEEKIEDVVPPRTIVSRLLDYSAHAAIIVGLVGFAWTVSDHVVSRPGKTDPVKADAPVAAAAMTPPAPQKPDEMTELRLANMKMHDEIRSLKASVDSLRTASRRDTTPEQLRVLSAAVDNLKGTVGSAKSETRDAIAQLQGKVDKLQPGKFQALSDRVGRLEHQTIDTASTGSIAKSEPRADKAEAADSTRAAPKPPSKPSSLAAAEEKAADENKPQIIAGWVVRDVYQGVALIEGKRGNTLEVVPGVSIPGAGVVKSIDRKGSGWTITTSKGQLAFAGGQQQAQEHEQPRDYRRGPYRGGYGGGYGGGGYRYDY